MADMTHPSETSSSPTYQRLRERNAVRDQIVALAEQAQREIVVFAPRLDPYFFNVALLSQALASFAVRHRQNRARILVEDVQQAVKDNDRLTGLCRRLGEFISLRQVGEDHRGRRDMFVQIDRRGYLYQQEVTRLDCLIDTAGGGEATALAERFDEMWERSEPVTAIQPLGL